ncbi:glycine betaine ABC transporter substrate-binding protein [Streptomyces sp. NPDC057253]|uniref:glycine betaine ABC transporter substrate-binding protein n=1 Tax=Streptomyces sp. NPDC057253 TaxID=3346069 RepID=UPI003633EB8C
MNVRIPPRREASAAAFCSLLLLLSACAGGAGGGGTPQVDSADGPQVTVIGTDASPESRVAAALYGELLDSAGVRVRTAATVYASPGAAVRAVVDGRIGLAPAYETATLRALPAGQTASGSMATTLSMALPPGVDALPPADAQGGVVLAVTRDTARKYRLLGLQDLGRIHARLTVGGAAVGAPDAPSAETLNTAYGAALIEGGTSHGADVLVLRSTDPSIARDGLTVLADPKTVVPPEHLFPLISAPAADSRTRKALAVLGPSLTTDQLAALTSSVAAGESPTRAARTWLRTRGLLH